MLSVTARPEGEVQVLRAAKKGWPSSCGDVGSAALRDLGCERYND